MRRWVSESQSSTVSGVKVLGTGSRVVDVRVLNILGDGIRIGGTGAHVGRCTALDNGNHGIHVSGDAVILNSLVRRSTSLGLFINSRGTGYRSNVLTENNGGNVNAQVAGFGIELGPNLP